MPTRLPFVIAGAGLAGAKAAETLREEGFDGGIVLIGTEPVRPYERPPLSKEYLRGEAEGRPFVHDEGFYAEHDIELRTGETVTAIDAGARSVTLAGGEAVPYEKLLLATGSAPRRLTVAGADLDGVLYLRDLPDSDALGARLRSASRLVVVGAGWIGCEVAASARSFGVEVVMVEPAAVPLERVLGLQLGGFYRDLHVEHGVQVLTGTGVVAIEGAGRVERVRTSEGHAVDCDAVLVGIGAAPRTQLAEAAGADCADGVVVGPGLQTSLPGVHAAGDIAAVEHPGFGHLRVEHWAAALNQGPAAARGMLGHDEAYDEVPYFFSDQYDVGMEYSGAADPDCRVVLRGDAAAREFIAFWVRDGRVRAAMNVNVWDVTEPLQALIRSGAAVEDAALADPDVPLAELGAAS